MNEPKTSVLSNGPDDQNMLRKMLDNVKNNNPLIHNITNYVTVNDCANALLACGASPIMADDPEDAEEITAICGGLNLNIGTLNARTIPAMLAAGRKAGEQNHPIVLDPVGAGASTLRTNTAIELLDTLKITAVKGNISEIKTLASNSGSTRGVDASAADAITPETLTQSVAFAKELAAGCGAIIIITGAIDIVADAGQAFCIYNGSPMMSKVTGTGCMLSAITAAYLAANPESPLIACAGAVAAMGLCGELAKDRLTPQDGNAAYRTYIIDALYNLDSETLTGGARYEMH